MQERSKYEYYDENGDETTPPPPTKWYEVLIFLVLVILLPYLFGLFAILFTLGVTLFGFYFVTKFTANHGELKFPFLACAGVGVAFVLATLYETHQINLGEHAALIGFSLIFIFVFTLAPLTGLLLLFFSLLFSAMKRGGWRTLLILIVMAGLIVWCAPHILNILDPQHADNWIFEREYEKTYQTLGGQIIQRANASGGRVYGQFGTIAAPPWTGTFGYVEYNRIKIPATDHLYLRVRYSKNSPTSTDIFILLDDESQPRASLQPNNQGDWNYFVWSRTIDLGSVERGLHSITFATNGQTYGVADLDKFILTIHQP